MKKWLTILIAVSVMTGAVIAMKADILPGWMAFILSFTFVWAAIKLAR